jgi:hypothetical protein
LLCGAAERHRHLFGFGAEIESGAASTGLCAIPDAFSRRSSSPAIFNRLRSESDGFSDVGPV